MLVWVLVWQLSNSTSFAVSGIASRAACDDLGRKIASEFTFFNPKYKCFSYQSATTK